MEIEREEVFFFSICLRDTAHCMKRSGRKRQRRRGVNERSPSYAWNSAVVLNYYVDLRREGVLRPMGSIIHGEGGGLRREAPPDDTARDGERVSEPARSPSTRN